jgi:hypothetical protein
VTVEWPDRRADVINGLDTLASTPPALHADQRDPRWPDLKNAIHWVVDDTWWDHQDPADYVGLILHDEDEAAALRAVVELVVRVSDRQGPSATDAMWFADPDWSEVRQRALFASRLMRDNDAR